MNEWPWLRGKEELPIDKAKVNPWALIEWTFARHKRGDRHWFFPIELGRVELAKTRPMVGFFVSQMIWFLPERLMLFWLFVRLDRKVVNKNIK